MKGAEKSRPLLLLKEDGQCGKLQNEREEESDLSGETLIKPKRFDLVRYADSGKGDVESTVK
jgi:hypothetical protein